MPRAKIKRKSTAIDMTPMVDLAFLLVTFFMLTVKFRPSESVEVKIPDSVSQTNVAAKDILTITVTKDAKVLLAVDAQPVRERMITKMSARYNLGFSPEEIHTFGIQADVGVPTAVLRQWLRLPAEKRKQAVSGIPVDSSRNELKDWINEARYSNTKLRITVKADEKTPYPVIKKVLDTLQECKINQFNLITSAKSVEKQPTN